MLIDTIKLVPRGLETLDLKDAKFEKVVGEELCDALMLYNTITTLKSINLSGHPEWFDTNQKCLAWRNVLQKQDDLRELVLDRCGVTDKRYEILWPNHRREGAILWPQRVQQP